MKLSTTEFRQDIYNIIDKVIATGDAVEINRKGVIVKISADKKASKLEKLEPHSIVNCSDDELFNNDWSKEWSQEPQL